MEKLQFIFLLFAVSLVSCAYRAHSESYDSIEMDMCYEEILEFILSNENTEKTRDDFHDNIENDKYDEEILEFILSNENTKKTRDDFQTITSSEVKSATYDDTIKKAQKIENYANNIENDIPEKIYAQSNKSLINDLYSQEFNWQRRLFGSLPMEKIGGGAHGYVYAISYEGEALALKKMTPGNGAFEVEISAYIGLGSHPNILNFHGAIKKNSNVYLVFERAISDMKLANRDLQRIWTQALQLDLIRGLKHLHDHGIVHRDLTPANLFLLEKNGIYHAKLGDFGNAEFLSQTKFDWKSSSFDAPHEIQLGGILSGLKEQFRAIDGQKLPEAEVQTKKMAIVEERLKETYHQGSTQESSVRMHLGAIHGDEYMKNTSFNKVIEHTIDFIKKYDLRSSDVFTLGQIFEYFNKISRKGEDNYLEKMTSINPFKRPTMDEVLAHYQNLSILTPGSNIKDQNLNHDLKLKLILK